MKNKSKNINISWPVNGHFTIEDLQSQHPDIINITLRFRVNKAIEAGELTSIGKIKPAIGRPKLVLVRGKPNQPTLDAAKAAGVILDTQTDIAVAVPVATVNDTCEAPVVTQHIVQSQTVEA
jgi:hypothetical protein